MRVDLEIALDKFNLFHSLYMQRNLNKMSDL